MKYRDPQYQDVEFAILLRHRKGMVIPRFTPINWWECDVCEITDSGYFREFEIKMNRRDFVIDAQKDREVWNGDYRQPHPRPREKKHDLLANHDVRGPAEFWYVAPKGVIPVALVPQWAGLIEIEMGALRPVEIMAKRAPRIHKQKANPAVRTTIEGACYWRFHHVLQNQYHRWKTKFSPPTNSCS